MAFEDVTDEFGKLETEVLKYSCDRCFEDVFCLCPFSFENTDFDLENRLKNGTEEGIVYTERKEKVSRTGRRGTGRRNWVGRRFVLRPSLYIFTIYIHI